jgi:SAM-dependent methyltransferase
VVRFAPRIPARGAVLDLACGNGRHARFLLARGHTVCAVDRDVAAIAAARDPGLEVLAVDLECTAWALPGRIFAGVVVTNYLWRPLWPSIVAAVAPGGVLIYETFARGHEQYGRPRNPDFLLLPGELLDAVRGELEVVAYEHGPIGDPPHAVVQRICAVRPAAR